MKIGFIGLGFVGGATKQVFEKNHETFTYDKYKEPYNSEEHLKSVAENSEIIFLSLPTPMKPSGEIDYSAIYDSLDNLKKTLEEIKRSPEEIIIVIRSTSVSGSSDKLAEQYPFRFAVNPEFLTERNALEDMKKTDKVVIGTSSLEDYQKIYQAYHPVFPYARYVHVDRKTAEMIKYSANVFLTGQVTLANEIYQICQVLGVDYKTIKEVVLFDKRIGTHINVPGPDGDLGFGGKCFPKDINALIYLAREKMYRPYLLEEMWRLNERIRTKKDWFDIPGATSENQNFKEFNN
ncbi:MAG: hypothetical protein KKF48_03280 [Nanoarchaeota archaeon]|nr:hypothetical protein [Nanoarchaeota archaeon]MBU1028041.1 hypothetical protein [Nanoarchaeota archaeon]